MINETMLAKLGTQNPEDNPALAGGFPPKDGAGKPLTDGEGRPLLQRIAHNLAQGATLPAPAVIVQPRPRSVLDAGQPYPAIDVDLLDAYARYGRRLHDRESAELLLEGGRRLVRSVAGLGHQLGKLFLRTPGPARDRKRANLLLHDAPQDVAERVANFYGRGL